LKNLVELDLYGATGVKKGTIIKYILPLNTLRKLYLPDDVFQMVISEVKAQDIDIYNSQSKTTICYTCFPPQEIILLDLQEHFRSSHGKKPISNSIFRTRSPSKSLINIF